MVNKYIIVLLLFVATWNLYSQDVVTDGAVQFYYPNGKLSSEGIMKEGKPDGYWITYYVTGVRKSEGKRYNHLLDSVWVFYNQVGDTIEKINYKFGKKNGYSLRYDYDEKDGGKRFLSSKMLYLNDKKDGRTEYYYPGSIIKSFVTYVLGKKQGLSVEYARDGQVIGILEYHNGYLINSEDVNSLDTDSLKQGVWKEFYPNGKIYIERNYLDGQLNGYYKEYDENGGLRFILRYENGKLINESSNNDETVDLINNYDDNGILISSGTFRKDTAIGIHRYYKPDGSVKASVIFDNYGKKVAEGIITKEGKKQGIWKNYYPVGKLRSTGSYKDNYRTAKWVFYSIEGKIEQTGSYRKGKINGNWKWFYDDGSLLREEDYFNGSEDGLSVEYSRDAKIISRGEYINGEKEGVWRYELGDHVAEGKYITGLKEGLWKHYYPDGQLKFSGVFRMGLAEGKHKFYYNNGQIKEERYFERGLRQKNWKKYDEEGKLILTINYKDDIERRINGVKVKLDEDIKKLK